MTATPDATAIRAFLDDAHVDFAAAIGVWAARELAPLPEPASDADARIEARVLLAALGAGGWFEPIRRQDWRACCLAREAIAAASPLADAVFALQALSVVPLQLGDNDAMRARWLDDAIAGRAMGAFAMTEPEAGTDVAAMATTARREGGDYVLDGRKVFISNAGIADFYNVFATTDPAAGGKGIGCFVVPADARGFRFERPFVLSSPLGGAEVTADDVLDATAYVTPALELIDARSHRVDPIDKVARTVVDTICDNAANAGILTGGERLAPRTRDLRWVAAIAKRNGTVEETGVAAGVLDDPVQGIVWLARRLAGFGVTLQAGETILCGSFTRPMDCRAGDHFEVDFGDLGSITVDFR